MTGLRKLLSTEIKAFYDHRKTFYGVFNQREIWEFKYHAETRQFALGDEKHKLVCVIQYISLHTATTKGLYWFRGMAKEAVTTRFYWTAKDVSIYLTVTGFTIFSTINTIQHSHSARIF